MRESQIEKQMAEYNSPLEKFEKDLLKLKEQRDLFWLLNGIELHLTSIGNFEQIKAEKLLVMVRGIKEQAEQSGFTQDEFMEVRDNLLKEINNAKSIRKGHRFV